MKRLLRALHATWALAIAAVVVVPNLPTSTFGELPGTLAGVLRNVGFVQSWRMYAPDPQRAQTYMNLTAHYADGRREPLEETLQEQAGWGTTWAWAKTRIDIWRHYANFRPEQPNDHRTWYLRAMCVREARRGEVPTKIVMEHVRRRFTPPRKVAEGKAALGEPQRKLVTVQYCAGSPVAQMIEADRARREAGS